MIANVALVIIAEIVCFFCSTFIAGVAGGFAAAFFRAPHLLALTGLLEIPALIGLGHFTGRWLARRHPRPTANEIITGCVIYSAASAALTAVVHPAVAAVALVVNVVVSGILYRSAQRTGPGAAILANNA